MDETDSTERPLSGVAADTLSSMVDVVVETDRLPAMIAAMRAEQIDKTRQLAELTVRVTTSDGMKPWSQGETARRTLVTELALGMRIPEATAQHLIYESEVLVHRLPATLEGLRAGNFSYRHAASIIDHAMSLPESLQAEFESLVLPLAAGLTVSKFDRRARTIRERMDAASIAERHRKAREDRAIHLENARDGMVWLHHLLPAAEGHAIYNHVTDVAIAQQGPGEERTLTQLRSDVAADLLLDGEVPGRREFGIRPWVALTVPVLTLLGHGTDPAVLEGYGPVDIDTARRLTANAPGFLRVLTDPESGVTLSVGRRMRKIPAQLRRWLRLVDETCRKPGCNRAAKHCDIDHTQEWQRGGQTAHDNLAHFCPEHHNEKHHTATVVEHRPDGTIEWTTPSGRSYSSEPAVRFSPESSN